MARFVIAPADPSANPGWKVELAGCTPEHARSVLEQLGNDPTVPSGLQIAELPSHPKRRWWRRKP